MKINKIKISIMIILIFLVGLFINPAKSQAVLQSNGGADANYDLPSWLVKIRKMEKDGGTFGLHATQNGRTLLDTSESNGLDVHMQLNTEYGAMAILSASAYGNPAKVENGGTTTGNETGIVMKINSEWVSAGSLPACSQYVNSDSRYKNIYTTSYVAKKGDAVSETEGWYGSTNIWIDFIQGSGGYYDPYWNGGIVRAYMGSIFSFWGNVVDTHFKRTHPSRAVVVVGEGL